MSDQVFEFPKITPPKLSMKLILMGVAVLVVLVILLGSFYQVQPEEVGLILRFGKHVRTTGPGLHLKMPFAENVLKVPVQRQLKQEFGFSTVHMAGAGGGVDRYRVDPYLFVQGEASRSRILRFLRASGRSHGHRSADGRPSGDRKHRRGNSRN